MFLSSQPYVQWRGSPIRVGFDVQALAELGWDVDMVTLPLGEDRLVPGVRVWRVWNVVRRRDIPIGPSIWKALYDILLVLWGLAVGWSRRPAAVHAVEDAGLVGWVVARAYGAKLVFEKHSDPASHRKGWLKNLVLEGYRRVEGFVIRHADAVIGTGPGLVEQARGVRGDRAGCVFAHVPDIPSSLRDAGEQERGAWRARLCEAAGDRLVMYVGSFAVYQGIDLLFGAMPLVLRERPEARFVVIGGTEQEIAQRRAWLRDRGVESRVTFLGKLPPDDLPAVLRAADVLLSPRIAGTNTPLKLLDYLKAGVAIVGTDTEANRQILDENTAVLARAEPSALAEAVARVLGDDGLRERLAAGGMAKIRGVHNFAEFRRRLGVCYRDAGVTGAGMAEGG